MALIRFLPSINRTIIHSLLSLPSQRNSSHICDGWVSLAFGSMYPEMFSFTVMVSNTGLMTLNLMLRGLFGVSSVPNIVSTDMVVSPLE